MRGSGDPVDDRRIEAPTDVLVKITTTAIRGSGLHIHKGNTVAETGIVFGQDGYSEVVLKP